MPTRFTPPRHGTPARAHQLEHARLAHEHVTISSMKHVSSPSNEADRAHRASERVSDRPGLPLVVSCIVVPLIGLYGALVFFRRGNRAAGRTYLASSLVGLVCWLIYASAL
jgi:hypothetical protein